MQLNDGNEKPTPYVLAHKEGFNIHQLLSKLRPLT